MVLRAKTMVDLKAMIRAEMGWSDRRSWSQEERAEVARLYDIKPDHKRGDFIAARSPAAAFDRGETDA